MNDLIPITGNTYPVKEQLKALGARWNKDKNAWMVTVDKVDEANALVASAGPYTSRSQSKPGPASRRSFGALAYRSMEKVPNTTVPPIKLAMVPEDAMNQAVAAVASGLKVMVSIQHTSCAKDYFDRPVTPGNTTILFECARYKVDPTDAITVLRGAFEVMNAPDGEYNVLLLVGRCTSASVGDYIYTTDHGIWLIKGEGFEKVTLDEHTKLEAIRMKSKAGYYNVEQELAYLRRWSAV